MKVIGKININNIKIQELERKTDSLSTETISPPTGEVASPNPLSVGPDLTVKAWVCVAFKSINYYPLLLTEYKTISL
jgi:hypothetical protein